MILPDSNLLLYAHNAGSPLFQEAAKWWVEILNGKEAVGLAESVVMAFIRISTGSRVFREPLTLQEVQRHVARWKTRPLVRILQPMPGHVDRVLKLLEQAGSTAGNLVSDAQLADLALEHGGVVHTNDRDFLRFPGLRWSFPLQEKKGRNPVI
jgi:toxin-antitoxin system PIN domain toxin